MVLASEGIDNLHFLLKEQQENDRECCLGNRQVANLQWETLTKLRMEKSRDVTTMIDPYLWHCDDKGGPRILVTLRNSQAYLVTIPKVGSYQQDIAIPAHSAPNKGKVLSTSYAIWYILKGFKDPPPTRISGEMSEPSFASYGKITSVSGNRNASYRGVILQILWRYCQSRITRCFGVDDI